MSVTEGVVETICEVLDVKPDEVKLDQTLYDSLGVDSTEMVEVSISLNKKYNINLVQREISNKQTPQEIIDVVKEKIAS